MTNVNNRKDVAGLLTRMREKAPLIHNITNVVVTNFTANGLLAIGASPVMAYAKEEVEEMATIADALVLNIGTLTADNVESMIIAGKAANAANTPVILDPVGAGATSFRTKSIERILNNVKISLLRGNAAEVANVAGMEAEIKGVDSVSSLEDHAVIAVHAAKKNGVSVCITGERDVVTDGQELYYVGNGHPIMTKVTGAGCLLSSCLAAFIAVEDDVVRASIAGLVAYGIAAEKAVNSNPAIGPGSFQAAFLDELNSISEEDINQDKKIEGSQGE
ncbi:hydroxyethylthiazole kinase [Niallia taxi]|uniref:hydroxyethylthiazole kinase n=1 Tax=Niallia taxi TaxID=2499688 RepID=UPI002E1B9694|nr:hydroxyethylthiazole kinase [Niallia taxi]MED3963352.1 hydroxyethylthiazole kinase [Niallia taxi]